MLKFRTMRHGSSGPAVSGGDDPRVTPLGRFLRGTRIDELPQLWNVVRGEMRLVGPRPEDPSFVAAFDDEYREILSVPPGLTGPAQLEFAVTEARALIGHPDPSGHYVTTMLPEKVAIELEYVRSRSRLRDLEILAATALLPDGLVVGRALAAARRRLTRAHGYALLAVALLVVTFLAAAGSPR
jgi:lipopolysaccharide/colanic/teichoic acid biosynthesis glycosyltransferase